MCINKRVLLGVGAVALVALAFSPRLLAGIAPLLVLAVCPLSMVFMMRTMGARGRRQEPAATGEAGDRQLLELEEEVSRLKAEFALRDENRPA